MGMNLKHYSILLLVLFWASCANRGIGPQGGPKDTQPPRVKTSEPEIGVLEFKGKKIEVTFDEYIELKDLASNLLMSPPQQTPPDVKARGKRLIVNFQDSLRDNTTYTIDFGNAVVDYREQVPLRGYSFYFSTGATIDTLEYSGYVYDAENLNPKMNMFVGVYDDLSDTAFVSHPFLRVARTDSTGHFRIGNMKEGTYRLYAVDDVSRDYRLTIGEALAFADEPIQPYIPPKPVILPDSVPADSLATDSIPADSLTADSVAIDMVVMDSVPVVAKAKLFLFKEEQQKLYLKRTTRDERHRIQIAFSATPDSLPELKPLTDSLNYITKYSAQKDTITIWLADSFSIAQDSLFIEARYRRTDSLYHLEWTTDTLRAIWRAPKLSAKAQAARERQLRNKRLDLKSNARSGFEVYDTLKLLCTTPLASIEREHFHLYERVDTVLKPIKFDIADHDTLPQELRFIANLKPEKKYELQVDSGALHDIYGITHVAGSYALQVKAPSDYSTLRVKLTPFVEHARIQLLNKQDQVVRELPAVPEGAFFEFIKPDKYYLRLYIDANEDGKWTTGSWTEKRQPEEVYYFPQSIQTKSNWDFEEEWNYQAVEQTKAKPAELIKVSSAKK